MSLIQHKDEAVGSLVGLAVAGLIALAGHAYTAHAESVEPGKPAAGSVVKLMYGVSYRGTNCIIVETKNAVSIGCGAVAP